MITFSIWYDFSFEGIGREPQNMINTNKLQIYIDIQDLLYKHFNKLLGRDESIIIDDDHSLGNNIKTLKICKEETKINITFENNEKNPKVISKFNIFIKNIMKDNRSKLFERNDIKERLIQFFEDVREEFLEHKCKSENKEIIR